MESGGIPDGSITASSFYLGEHNHAPFHGRLNGVAGIGAWGANSDTIGEWFQADLGEMKRVTATITQGRCHNADEWVTSYKLQYGATGTSWTTYTSNNSSEKVFPGNVDRNTPVTNLLDYPIDTRYVRFLPQTWHGWISMRVEILGCTLTSNPQKIIFPTPRTTSNYARLMTSLTQDLDGFTMCMHMRIGINFSTFISYISYAVAQTDNELLIYSRDNFFVSIRFHVDSYVFRFVLSIIDMHPYF
ncbi:lactadherin-like [Branchiostoma floridae x Branchiostoma belcheri]